MAASQLGAPQGGNPKFTHTKLDSVNYRTTKLYTLCIHKQPPAGGQSRAFCDFRIFGATLAPFVMRGRAQAGAAASSKPLDTCSTTTLQLRASSLFMADSSHSVSHYTVSHQPSTGTSTSGSSYTGYYILSVWTLALAPAPASIHIVLHTVCTAAALQPAKLLSLLLHTVSAAQAR